jgi:septin family protein
MFVYYSDAQVRNQDFKGPDFFIVKHVDGLKQRNSWIVWYEESRFPDVIIELLSESTEERDLGFKKDLYERTFRTAEYFCADFNMRQFYGWRLAQRHYVEIPVDERGWRWSEEMQLWLGAWHGTFLGQEDTWLRFYHPDGSLVLLPEEAERQRAEAEHQRAEAEHQRAEAEHQRAEAAEERAHTAEEAARTEREQRQALQAELERMQAELERMRGTPPADGEQ